MDRKAGVLMPVSANISEYGIGDFGKSAYAFVDFIAEMGFSVWQVLPITTIGAGNSPYSGISAFAGNYLLIDIDSLPESLATQEEKNEAKHYDSAFRVCYDHAREFKRKVLLTAFSRIDSETKALVSAFKKENADWLNDYASFMAKREKNPKDFYYYEQYIFFEQWFKLKEYANARGVSIFGDMPIYVSLDSVDVASNPTLFELDAKGKPTRVAGVPPDYFAEDGQLWGNPLYNYKEMEKDNYKWFVSRLTHNLKIYDYLRLDHFRGFYSYWAVPATAKTAKEGEWVKGFGAKIFKALEKVIKNPPLIAEDLGIIDDNVAKFVKESGFPCMRVLHFAFDNKTTNPHLPFNYDTNTVAYTGTHDNNTTLGWLTEMDAGTRDGVLNFLDISGGWAVGGGDSPAVRSAIKQIIASSARLAIIPMQDLAGYGADTRTNTPGVPLGNWEYRATSASFYEVNNNFILNLNRKYGRTNR
ncbi:MAG: 4-alpha-glucanotransferase [Firmicutes bacterium]|nr:4-alpha-glucanotransferase [Bacillota bacterium]